MVDRAKELMTLKAFYAELAKGIQAVMRQSGKTLDGGRKVSWEILDGSMVGAGRHSMIRILRTCVWSTGRVKVNCYCPVTFVALLRSRQCYTVGEWGHAAYSIGLPIDRAKKIIYSADEEPGARPAQSVKNVVPSIRKALQKAVRS